METGSPLQTRRYFAHQSKRQFGSFSPPPEELNTPPVLPGLDMKLMSDPAEDISGLRSVRFTDVVVEWGEGGREGGREKKRFGLRETVHVLALNTTKPNQSCTASTYILRSSCSMASDPTVTQRAHLIFRKVRAPETGFKPKCCSRKTDVTL